MGCEKFKKLCFCATYAALEAVILIAKSKFLLLRLRLFQVMLQSARHAVAPRLLADVAILAANGFLYGLHGVVRRDDATGEIATEHRQIVEVIARREDVVPGDAKLTGDFGQGRPLV